MIKFVAFFVVLLLSFGGYAQGIDVRELDRGVRSSKSRSIMFKKDGAEILRESLAKKNEEEARKRAEEEAKLRREQQIFKPYNMFGDGFKIMATINGEMLTNQDLQERANLFSLTTGMLANEKNEKIIRNKVLQNTIDEKIKLQEAEKIGVSVSDKEVLDAYVKFEKSNGVPSGGFKRILKEYQISEDVFLIQIKANLLWNKLIARKVGQNIGVSQREINDEINRIKKDMQTPKYMVSEIMIRKKDAEHIEELVEILKTDNRFELYAVQFSQSASAPSGGKLGWITEGQLAEPLEKAIKELKVGDVSKAILYRNDYYIFRLEKIYKPNQDEFELPSYEEVEKFIENRKSDEIANKYIRDLRNRAVVEKKF